ncbi:MAG: DUF3347 domain-containing protein [Cyclobacteriaceae bacterium]
MKKQLIIALCLIVTTGAYAQHDHSKMDHSKHSRMEDSFTVSKDFQVQLNQVFTATKGLTESFIDGNSKDVSKEAGKVKSVLTKVDMKLLTSKEAHMSWMMNLKEMNTALDKLSGSTEIDAQKKEYAKFNDALYKSIKSFGLGGNTAYYQHCPMALDNQGGYWLSQDKEIRNPYLGSKMLKCGSTKETLN